MGEGKCDLIYGVSVMVNDVPCKVSRGCGMQPEREYLFSEPLSGGVTDVVAPAA